MISARARKKVNTVLPVKQLPFRIKAVVIESKLLIVPLARKTGTLLSELNMRYCLTLVISGWEKAK